MDNELFLPQYQEKKLVAFGIVCKPDWNPTVWRARKWIGAAPAAFRPYRRPALIERHIAAVLAAVPRVDRASRFVSSVSYFVWRHEPLNRKSRSIGVQPVRQLFGLFEIDRGLEKQHQRPLSYADVLVRFEH